MLTFIPLALTSVERHPELIEWVDSWWLTVNTSWITPDGWYAGLGQIGTYVWCPPPAAADAALEQLCKCHLKRPGGVPSLFIVPRLLTSRWRKRGFRAETFTFTIPSATVVWKRDSTNHEFVFSAFLFLVTGLGAFNVPNLWEILRRACTGCNISILPVQGVFCANFSSRRGPWNSCRSVWCGTYYVQMKLDKYPVKTLATEDGEAVLRCLQDVQCMEG
jgi:hypothetical protein